MSMFVVLQMSAHMLKLTPVKKRGKKFQYGIPVPFVLPEVLLGGDFEKNIYNFAEFSNTCLRQMKLNKASIVICIDDESVVSKEFDHLPAKPSVLASTARLEAESVLPDGSQSYFIETCPHTDTLDSDGMLKSMLYAVPAALIRNIRKEFKRYGLNVIRIAPPICGLVSAGRSLLVLSRQKKQKSKKERSKKYRSQKSNASKTIIQSEEKREVIAIVDLGFEKIGLAMFADGVPIFERAYESVYDEMIDIVCETRGLSLEGAERQLRRDGVSSAAGAGHQAEQDQINLLIESSCGEVVRSIRVVLSSERLELDNIIFCGSFTSLSNFSGFIDSLGLDIPYQNIATYAGFAECNIALQMKTAGSGFHSGDFFTMSGLLTPSKNTDINFLNEPNSQISNSRATLGMMALLTLLLVFAMSIQPFQHFVAQGLVAQDEIDLVSPIYDEGKDLNAKRILLREEIEGIIKDNDALPYDKSKANKTQQKVFNHIASRVTVINSFSYDNNTGLVGLEFSVDNFDAYLAVRDSIMSDGYFSVAVPFTATEQMGGASYLCRVTLKVTAFEKFPADLPPAVPTDKTEGGDAS